MDPLSKRVDVALKGLEGIHSPNAAFQHIVWTLEREKQQYEKEIWDPRTTGKSYRKLRAEYRRLCEDILIVQSLLNVLNGNPLPERARPKVTKPPKAGY